MQPSTDRTRKTDNPWEIAEIILDDFDGYRRRFRGITQGAPRRFEDADWAGVQKASTDRIELYNDFANNMIRELREQINPDGFSLSQWREVKACYEQQIRSRIDFDLAETVFNTVFRKLFPHERLNDENAFVTEPLSPAPRFDVRLTCRYGPSTNIRALLKEILDDYAFSVGYIDSEQDIDNMVDAMQSSIPLLRKIQYVSFEMLRSVFYRNKGAYLIGRMYLGEHDFPLAIPLHNESGKGIYVDTIIWNENDLSIIFSFTRSYFMVDVDYPNEMVNFLQELLPNKKRWELYTALGFYKHGKTEFFRGFLDHLENSDDQFVIAEGIRGLVMAVFTLPSYQTVFKVIKDRFSPTKRVTRKQVRDAYYLVKTHDRVGRMADTQEFTDMILPRARFSEDLIEELLAVAASSVTLTEEFIIISHLYTERLMTPLNIYIERESNFEVRQALDEYGNAIKQLAAANIFPGDMLLKNFGVTRHGRVVFYDYDEICYLTDINFRKIPAARYPEDELASEPWYSVGPNDVFPEEFPNFLFNSNRLREYFCENHADLFTVEYWQDVQRNIREDRVMDVFPYRRKRRFARHRET
ncbi:MAG: bifunctional isocitrate dehydrogenase kinase/phosphatase [Pseudomonadales bacterium]|nr:bifunctional isocitrate dehydrogenase kinase/phosphatase [Pseudomonadales bacterium]